ncbi:MAG: hypothetical protein ACTHJ4_04595 [Candidatus Nucleicultricaceae bacterium]
MSTEPVIKALAKYFNLCDDCGEKRLAQYLELPYNRARAEFFLRGKELRTNYKDKSGDFKKVRFCGLTSLGPKELYAYHGFLG